MRPVITPDEARRLDAAAGEPVDVLMERAGLAVALEAVAMGAGYGDRVTVLAGAGNNGGDGYVAARHLARRGVAVEILAVSEPADGTAAKRAAEAAAASGLSIRPLTPPHSADLVIDSVFGTGFHGSLPGPVAAWTETEAPVLAVDIPSGVDASTGAVEGEAFAAVRTVAFHALKPGHVLGEGPDRCGIVRIVDIGLSGGVPVYRMVDAADAPRPRRGRTAHKWSVGSVLVAGGGRGTTGAALLAALGALRAGAGAVAVAAPAAAQPVYAALSPDVLTIGIGAGDSFGQADAATLISLAGRYDALVLGPGLGPTPDRFVAAIASGWPGALILDADALSGPTMIDVLAERSAPTILTPHGGEFRRLTGAEPTVDEAERLAAATGGVVVLKGNPTVVAAAERWLVDSGGPELATIGTGDVLAGMVGAFVAAGMPPDVAARSAAFHHGVAGRRLAATGPFTASELAAAVAADPVARA